MNKTIIGFIIALIVVGAASFYGGMRFERSKSNGRFINLQNLSPEERRQRFQEFGFAGRGGAGGTIRQNGVRSGGDFVAGEIISKDDQGLTVKLPDGGSKIIFLSASTEIAKAASGTPADLAVGKQVTVAGNANPDGSLTARTIQLREPRPPQP